MLELLVTVQYPHFYLQEILLEMDGLLLKPLIAEYVEYGQHNICSLAHLSGIKQGHLIKYFMGVLFI
jgi:hypothetical protein